MQLSAKYWVITAKAKIAELNFKDTGLESNS